MKTNPVFRASYPVSSEKSDKKKLRKQKVVQAIFEKSQEKIGAQKKLPKGKVSLQKSSPIKFSELTKKR